MTCKHCGQALPRGARVCPACGRKIPSRRWLWGTLTVLVLVLAASATLIYFNLQSRAELPELSIQGLRSLFAKEESVEPEAAGEPEATEEPVLIEESVPIAEPEPIEEPAPAEESVEALAIEAAPPVDDRTVLDAVDAPESGSDVPLSDLEFYRAVETRRFAALSEALCTWSEQSASAAAEPMDQKLQLLYRLSLDEAGRKLAGRLVNYDLAWLDSLAVHFDVNLLALRSFAVLSLSLNDSYILGAELLADTESGALALRLPELAEGWFVPEDMELALEGPGADPAYTRAVLAALPARERLEALLERYFSLVLQGVGQVERGVGTLEAEGVLQECTTLSVEIDGETASRLLATLIGELRWDTELEAMLRELALAAGEDPDESRAAFLSALDELDYELACAEDEGETLRMTLYVDEAGAVRGQTLRIVSAYESAVFSFACPRDGERFGLELRALVDGELLELAGRGEAREGGPLTGSFLLRENNATVARLGFESRAMTADRSDYTLRIEPGRTFTEALAAELPEELRSSVSALCLTLRVDAEAEEAHIDAELTNAGEPLFTLEAAELLSTGALFPEAGETMSQSDWLAGLSYESAEEIFTNLRDAGLPGALRLALRASWRSLFVE